ncbi:hypothetical protein [Algisphaera agarilytica]|uniref:Uncharacterized protein n=1 Tax=Algisphaera agarilytica TaxID=1385975 RepID=A0A7X0LLP9_9BACT|nr:hypothetical protein [Algisphaera agarilytica]MBB6430861.1 hypothetical protein [Algisphaera agarilytica]
MPPKDSIIPSPVLRSAVIAAVMLSLLGGSLALAWAMTGAPLTPPTVPMAPTVSVAGATLTLPAAWELESTVAQEDNPVLQWTFTNQSYPSQRLRVIRFASTQQADPGIVLGNMVVPQLVAGSRPILQPDSPWYRYDRSDTEMGDSTDVIFSTQRLALGQTPPQLHAVRMLSPDEQNFWVFQLTDQVAAEHWHRDLELLHMDQLRRLLNGFAYESGS